jgi:ribosomal protein S18 acetylase RimI-like enzyme
MAVTVMQYESEGTLNPFKTAPETCITSELSAPDEPEVLDFLAARPIHTVFMASLIRDNGIVSPRNRGSFYACRNRTGQLKGVGLIGHATIIEAQTDDVIASFARLAGDRLNARLIRGEREQVNSFWAHYAYPAQQPRRICQELLYEQRGPLPLVEPVDDLRLATLDELDQVSDVNAAMAFQEGSVSPLQSDPVGFRQRTARRIELGRVWVWVQDGKLIFKADVIAETPEAVYLEGIHVHPEERLKGHGLRCLTQLGSTLLTRSKSICLTLNQNDKKAKAFYEKAGYKFQSHYETIYLR